MRLQQIVDSNNACQGKLKTEIYDGFDRERAMMKLLREERAEVLFWRKHIREVHKLARETRQRIAFAIDCVGGRPTADCEPMGWRLHVGVPSILSRAVDSAAQRIEAETNLENMQAHKRVRDVRNDGLPDIDTHDRDRAP